ncbi:MAG TPA: protein phosphatase 2C domain-containing protein [Chloroflexota bacterium]|nr:protein phosphatase 2C domain-containing protein [Chloroflexota bacterium]
MRLRVRPLVAPKRGSTPEEYEDARWPVRSGVHRSLRCAVADGATEASFSGLWARLLVEAFRHGRLDAALTALPALQEQWQAAVAGIPLPWYAEEKARLGAFSALLGVTVTGGRWDAVAVGDSCLFHIREGGLLAAFPIERAEDLAAAPHLVSSLPRHNAALPAHLRTACGELRDGDVLYLATDAMAGWLLRRLADGACHNELAALRPAGFPAWLDAQRDAGTIRNDDTTLIRIDAVADTARL